MNLKPLTSWLEDGGPLVSPELAQARGMVCAKCPHNLRGDWWERISKQPVAAVIKKWLEIKHDIHVGVPIEDELGLCDVCGCVMRLKCHEPIKYISEHTDEETMKGYPDFCWIKKERT